MIRNRSKLLDYRLVALGVAVAGLVVWLLWPAKVEEPASGVAASDFPEERRRELPPAGLPVPAAASPLRAAAPGAASDGGEPHRPHPITDDHLRIRRENQLIQKLNDAMDLGDFITLRKVLAGYREEYPEDAQGLQEGYERVADCLEFPGPETRARGKKYWEEHRGSTLRRFIRRHCGFELLR
ncbi:MAG TPA: hypothetical protein VF989_03735 [Polyangiaceae bacterium]